MDKIITAELKESILEKLDIGGLTIRSITKKLSSEERNEIACYGVAQVLCNACVDGQASAKNGYFKRAKPKRTIVTGSCSREEATKTPRHEETLPNPRKDRPAKKVLVCGLDNAGKTSILNRIKGINEVIKPTVGFKMTSIENNHVILNLWELGGNENVRSHWNIFFEDTSLLIYVVDAADEEKLLLANYVFQNVIMDERLTSVPLLLLANKQDVNTAKKTPEIERIMEMRRVCAEKRHFRILETSATSESDSYHSVAEIEDAMFDMVSYDN